MTRYAFTFVSWVAFGLAATAWSAPDPAAWRVPDAPVRVDLQTMGAPSDPVAGWVAVIPDGGALPRPVPDPVVLDEDGRPVPHEPLWWNPGEGLAIAIQAPASGKVSAYLRAAGGFTAAEGASGLKSSLMLCTHASSDASLESAKAMGSSRPFGRKARFSLVDIIGHRGNLLGAHDNYSSYYEGWLRIRRAGRYYLCTVSDEGSEVWLDGKSLVAWPGLHTRKGGETGRYGKMVDLDAGFHKIAYFHFEKTGEQEANLAWREPGVTNEYPHWITQEHFLHSGGMKIVGAATKEGGLPPLIDWQCEGYLKLDENKSAAVVYAVQMVPTQALPEALRVAWEIDGRPVEGITNTTLRVTFEDEEEHRVVLTLSKPRGSGGGQASRELYAGFNPASMSINVGRDLAAMREALYTRCRMRVQGQRPCQKWRDDTWRLLVAVTEPFKGQGLLQEVFERSREDLLARPLAERALLEDVYFENLCYVDKANAHVWLTRYIREETDRSRRFEWQMREPEFLFYVMGDAKAAEAKAAELVRSGQDSREQGRALVKAGNIALAQGNVEKATVFYREAARRMEQFALTSARTAPTPRPGAAPPPTDWRARAVRDATYDKTVETLIRQRLFREARQRMEDWELDAPMELVSGPFALVNAQYYAAVGDVPRALKILSAYRNRVELSPDLIRALTMELELRSDIKDQKGIEEVVAFVKKRLANHPIAESAPLYLAGSERDATLLDVSPEERAAARLERARYAAEEAKRREQEREQERVKRALQEGTQPGRAPQQKERR